MEQRAAGSTGRRGVVYIGRASARMVFGCAPKCARVAYADLGVYVC